VNLSLAGKVALVTGGSKGIGLAIAQALHGAGAKVAVLGRDQARADQAAASLGGNACAVQADVADQAQVDAAVEAAEKALGPIDILVNNAGVTKDGLLVRMSDADWDAVLNANLKGAFHGIKAVTRGMMKRRAGPDHQHHERRGPYRERGPGQLRGVQGGLIGLTKATAKELASRNILVNAIAPGFIDTDMTKALTEPQRTALLAQIPLGRLGQGSDIAGAVLFLASDLGGYISGQVLVVDGGMVM